MLPLYTRAVISGDLSRPLLKVLDLAEALRGDVPHEQVAVHLDDGIDVDTGVLRDLGFAAVMRPGATDRRPDDVVPVICGLSNTDVVKPGDVIRGAAGQRAAERALPARGEREFPVPDRAMQQPLPDVQPAAARRGRPLARWRTP
ncbi:hypothetical protein ACHMW5_11760 [Azospirillum melinis]|uniref:hypothetical protein n=1 Tax=Azospirillum melinis TaxID=328839 RepID=UPI00375732CD